MSRRPITIEKMVQEFKKNHTNSHLFKIDNFSLLTTCELDFIESSVFDLCGRKWKIFVDYNDDEKHVSIYLENQDPVDVELKYQVYVVSQKTPTWYPNINVKWDFSASPQPIEKGITNLMSLDDLTRKDFLIEDCVMFGASLPDQETEKPGTAECFSLIEKPLNNKVTWMMTKFSSFDPEKAHLSNEFIVGNRKWRIKVHPRGHKDVKGESFSVYLVGGGVINNSPKTDTYAQYKLRVLDQVNRNHVEKTTWNLVAEEETIGFVEFMPLSKLGEPYLVNDKLYVGVEFEVVSVRKYV